MGDFPHQIFERAFQLALGGHLAIQRIHDGEQVAIERDLGAGRCLDRTHDQAPKLLIAAASSAWISRKFCAPVIESIVSTRFCTPESFNFPPAALAWRYRSMRQPIVALSTYVTVDRSRRSLRSPPPINDVTVLANSERIGYIKRVSFTRTMDTSWLRSVVRFILILRFSVWRPADRAVSEFAAPARSGRG